VLAVDALEPELVAHEHHGDADVRQQQAGRDRLARRVSDDRADARGVVRAEQVEVVLDRAPGDDG